MDQGKHVQISLKLLFAISSVESTDGDIALKESPNGWTPVAQGFLSGILLHIFSTIFFIYLQWGFCKKNCIKSNEFSGFPSQPPSHLLELGASRTASPKCKDYAMSASGRGTSPNFFGGQTKMKKMGKKWVEYVSLQSYEKTLRYRSGFVGISTSELVQSAMSDVTPIVTPFFHQDFLFQEVHKWDLVDFLRSEDWSLKDCLKIFDDF